MKITALILFWLFFALTALLAPGAIYTSLAVKKAEREFPPLGTFLEIRGLRLHVFDTGGEGIPVVWIHGAHGSMYDYLIAFEKTPGEKPPTALPPGFRHIFIDRPGFGHSTRESSKALTIFDQAGILHEAVTRLGARKPILVGHSLGSAVAMAYAQEFGEDVSGVLLLGPYLLPYDGPVNPIHYIPVIPVLGPVFMETYFLPAVRTFFAGKFLEKVFAPDRAPARYEAMIRSMALRPNNYRSNASDIRLFGPGLYRLAEKYPDFKVPVVAVHGKDDQVAPYGAHIPFIESRIRSLVKTIPLEKTGHHPILVRRESVIEALSFLRDRISS